MTPLATLPVAAPLTGASVAWVCVLAEAEVGGTPTTIIGAFIAITLSMGALLTWAFKKLFDELDKRTEERKAEREFHDRQAQAMREEHEADRASWEKRADQVLVQAGAVIDAFRADMQQRQERLTREREQTAEYRDAERRKATEATKALDAKLDLLIGQTRPRGGG